MTAPLEVRLYEGLDWASPGLIGPLYGVGDCIFGHDEVPTHNWFDRTVAPRAGDLVLWYCSDAPRDHEAGWVPQGEEELTKWLTVIDGVEWLACKYWAVRRQPWYHHFFATRVAEFRYAPGAMPLEYRLDAARNAAAVRQLRDHAPRRPDVIVFPEDLFSPRYAAAAASQSGQRGA